jgi:multiple sugar transport system ATP-binding protein
MATIEFQELTKTFDDGTVAVDSVDLAIEDGEFVVLVGPSGSGKTTVLRMTAGLEDPTSGEVRIGGELVNGVDPQDRNIAMVFQNYALYPHMTVYDNMAFGLRLHGHKKGEIRSRVEPAAEMLGLGGLLKRKPAQLSGGQRQRVAMGRAIVRDPDAFLMDEPLSNLDAKLRVEMRSYVALLHQRLRTTTLYVTHDQTEAVTMGDRVAVMRDGRLEQCDVPQGLYDRPRNLFVAAFIGSPAMNLARTPLRDAGDGSLSVELGGATLRVPDSVVRQRPGLRARVGAEVIVGVRPEDLEDAALVPNANGAGLDVSVSLAEPMGAEVIAHFSVAGVPVASAGSAAALADRATEDARFLDLVDGTEGAGVALTARLSPRSRARTGEPLRLAVDVERLHFFDVETEDAIW